MKTRIRVMRKKPRRRNRKRELLLKLTSLSMPVKKTGKEI
jgi:hypothetical protein